MEPNIFDKIHDIDLKKTMETSYIDYAMSVIAARALPDVRDGLKPVQRRVLYSMVELNNGPDKPHRKSARIVGDTMGKYHPHGDSSIYGALVNMAQKWATRYPLVDGHGNFGSMDGDGAAAMRYTEARLSRISMEMLADIGKNTVDFMPNFDETEKEPTVLPARFPNILVNGGTGIAVGMATNIPPHNLREVIAAVVKIIDNRVEEDRPTTIEELMEIVKGPDFPTGGIIANKDDLIQIYSTGMGKIKIRGKVEVEQVKGGKERIVITEIPYTMIGANIGKFLNDVAGLVESKKAPEIVDISNQSSKEGTRIVLELKKGADVERITNLLYKKTRLEDTFGVNMLAVADGRPETLSLKQVIEHHVDFQFEVATRKYQNLLRKEMERREVQEGLIKACDVIDLIIEILRGSKTQKQVKECLIMGVTDGIRFKSKSSERMAAQLCFTERQATAILEMRLQKLIGLEVEALLKDHEATVAKITKYEDILNHYDSMSEVIMEDLTQIKKEYGHKRKTAIENAEAIVLEEPKVEEMDVVFLMDRFGYAKTIDTSAYERNKEAVHNENKYVFQCKNTDKICVFTDLGMMHSIKVMDIPYGRFRDKGTPIDNLGNYSSQKEQMIYVDALENIKNNKLLFVSAAGMVKLVDGSEFDVVKRTIAATKLSSEEDRLILAEVCQEQEYVVLQTKNGVFLRFLTSEVPEKKKAAVGVRGIRMAEDDAVEHAYLLASRMDYTITYHDKEISLTAKIKLAKRDTKGTKIRV